MRYVHIIITSILLWMIGLLVLSLIKGVNLEDELRANATYIVELKPTALPGQRITAESLIRDMDGIEASSVRHIGKAEARGIMLKDYPSLANPEWENPFHDIITFKANGLDDHQLTDLKGEIEKIPGVSALFWERGIYQGLRSGLGRFRWGLLLLSGILFLAVSAMIVYAIRLRLNRNREEVRTLTLSGVFDKEVMKPYLRASIQQGLMSAGLAIVALFVNIFLINRSLLNGVEISFLQTLIASAVVTLIGIGLYFGTTAATTSRFLRAL